MIPRIHDSLDAKLEPGKALLIYGPRRVGKTTLLKNYLSTTPFKNKLASGEDVRTRNLLSSDDFKLILEYVEGYELLALDEAQAIPGIGRGIKIIVDQRPDIRVVLTGSSSFELAGQTGEPLTGRKKTLTLYPIAQCELASVRNRHELREGLEDFLVYGSYPEVLSAPAKARKAELLRELADSYLLKDILAFDRVRNSKTILDLLTLLAFQVGSEVSANELGTRLGADTKTVQRYLDLLEKAFVLVRLGGLARNLRNEVSGKAKYYFMDTGIRNALIANFNGLALRDDGGALWENFAFIERLKRRSYRSLIANMYFWRTYDQKEIDLVEEREGRLFGYEMKWSSAKAPREPALWKSAYPNSSYEAITPSNYLDFVAG